MKSFIGLGVSTGSRIRSFAAMISFWLLTCVAQAGSERLADWRDWVLDQQPQSRCPWQWNSQDQHVCVWPGQLQLDLLESGLSFELQVDVYSNEAQVALPGDQKYWPVHVTLDNRPAPVVESAGLPWVVLPRGTHRLKGEFQWQHKPSSLTVPSAIALVNLRENGKTVALDRRNNQILFTSAAVSDTTAARDSLNVEVYRLLNDAIPVQMVSSLKLSVSGKPREITLGRVLPPDSQLLSLVSPLPARLEADGNLRVQVVAGEYRVTIASRFNGDLTQFQMQAQTPGWPAVEYLSFAADTQLRQVTLEGARSVDNTQLDMPVSWLDYPAYRLDADTRLTIKTHYRGDHAPLSNQLRVTRDLWLDFAGGGMTGRERVAGKMYRDWRLNTAPDTHLGRAAVAGEPVLITEAEGRSGIEIRSPHIQLQAVSRIDDSGKFSASGWDARVDSVATTLHLPPGWRVLHASGLERITGTWVSQWNLWAIFLLLVMVVASHKLLGLKAALLAAVAVALSYHEAGAPIFLLPLLLLLLALLGVLTGRWQRIISVVAVGLSAVLVFGLIAFAIDNFRLALYPSLERYQLEHYPSGGPDASGRVEDMAQLQVQKSLASAPRRQMALEEIVVTASKTSEPLYELDENDRVQTGPGLPTWLWNRVTLNSESPVSADQQLNIYFSPPLLTRIWRVACVLLLGLYTLLIWRKLLPLLRWSSPAIGGAGVSGAVVGTVVGAGAMVMLVGVLQFGAAPVHADEYPPEYLLNDLRQRLLQPPACLPGCVSLNNGRLESSQDQLTLHFNVYVDADIALPLPSSDEGWHIEQIMIDDQTTAALTRAGNQPMVRLSKGLHQLTLTGPTHGEQVVISLPLAVHNLRAQTEGWHVDGIVEGRVPGNTLTLRAEAKQAQVRRDTLMADPAVPFVVVERHFSFAKQWRLETQVRRLAPEQGPLLVSVGLLPFEKPLSDSLIIDNGRARLQFGSNQDAISWVSDIEPVSSLSLLAAEDPHYVETWSFAPSSLWHIDYRGLAPVKAEDDLGSLQPVFKPWPGEQLDLAIERPAGVAGPTYTVEQAVLDYTAGKRLQKSDLTIDIRSSLADEFTLILPETSEVTALQMDGKALNLPTGKTLSVPLTPGLQQLQVSFQEQREAGFFNPSPEVQLPHGATNLAVSYRLPHDRWLLFFKGPEIGPAILFWGVLVVILLGALALYTLSRCLQLPIPVSLTGWILLGLGLSTVNRYGVLVIAGFFFLLALRQQRLAPAQTGKKWFNSLQVLIVIWTLITALTLLGAIPSGLLASPDMQVVGNGSYSYQYHFYQDRVDGNRFPVVNVLSLPLLAYRLVMLLWSLWLATRLIQWAQWWWQAFSTGGVWVDKPKKRPAPSSAAVADETKASPVDPQRSEVSSAGVVADPNGDLDDKT